MASTKDATRDEKNLVSIKYILLYLQGKNVCILSVKELCESINRPIEVVFDARMIDGTTHFLVEFIFQSRLFKFELKLEECPSGWLWDDVYANSNWKAVE